MLDVHFEFDVERSTCDLQPANSYIARQTGGVGNEVIRWLKRRVRRRNMASESRRFQNVFDATDGNNGPTRPIVELVADFVNGFIEQIGFDHDL